MEPKYCFCGIAFNRHHQCKICGILMGKRHFHEKPIETEIGELCADCYPGWKYGKKVKEED